MKKKISIVIPYCNRINTLKYVLKALNAQTMDKKDFEIIVGCLEYSTELLDFVKKELSNLNLVLVMTNDSWNVSRARNIAIKEAIGDLIVFLDADILVQTKYLELTYQTYLSSDDPLFILGQTRDYDEGIDVNKSTMLAYEHYFENFLQKTAADVNLPQDVRWETEHHIEWALGWSANISLSREFLMEKDLLFDQNFKDWGVEDIEWAYRVVRAGAKIHFSREIWAIHLPHLRNVEKNHYTEKVNFKKMLYKWPALDVEIITTFGDIKGNQRFNEVMDNISRVTTDQCKDICTIEFKDSHQNKYLYVGACTGKDKTIHHNFLPDELKSYSISKILPLLGISLPYTDNSIKKIFYSPEIELFDEPIKKLLDTETKRISKTVIQSKIEVDI